MNTKEEIFDWVITFEDQALKNVREEVIKTAEFNFGDLGRKVAEKYYRQIDGEEDFDDEISKECDDCKEKAKKLIDIANLLHECNENLTSDKIDSYFIDFDYNNLITIIKNDIQKILDIIQKTTCLKIDKEINKELKRRILLEAIKRISKDDC